MAITMKFIKVVIERGWKPYIKSHWLSFGRGKAGYTIGFIDHPSIEYKCSYSTWEKIKSLAEV